ncbi:MAG TPA: DUF2892 domain-containing protein [bacterium]|nr:DUF2892 domain-containing protein [bacterium]
MKANMGLVDRLVRFLLAIVVLVLYLMNAISGLAAIILGIIALIFIITSFSGFCPLYVPLKLTTKKRSIQ